MTKEQREMYDFLIKQSTNLIWRCEKPEISPDEWFHLCLELIKPGILPEWPVKTLARRAKMIRDKVGTVNMEAVFV
jgi:hypothetical protein